MTEQLTNIYLNKYRRYFPASKIPILKMRINNLDEQSIETLYKLKLHNPVTMKIISIFFGIIGIDRFILKDYKIGIIKLLTLGAFGFLYVIDWFIVPHRTQLKNYVIICRAIHQLNNERKKPSH